MSTRSSRAMSNASVNTSRSTACRQTPVRSRARSGCAIWDPCPNCCNASESTRKCAPSAFFLVASSSGVGTSMQDRHLWSRSASGRGGGIIVLMVLILAGATALAWTTAGHNEQSTQAAPSFLATILPGYEPWGLAHDRAGNIWVAEPECDPNIYHHPV